MMELLSKVLVGDEAVKGETVDERSDAHRIETMAGQENEADEIAERVGQSQNFGRHAAFGTADGLAVNPPFCAPSVARDLDDGGVDHGVFHVWRVRAGLEKPGENVPFDPVAVALENSVPVAEERRKITPRASPPHDPKDRFTEAAVIASTAPGSVGLPRQCRSIFAHWASVSTNRSIQSLNHNQATGGI